MSDDTYSPGSLRASLTYEPVELRFGTSGRRGLVADLTQLEVYVNARAEIDYLAALPEREGGIAPGQEICVACDLRRSSTAFDAGYGGRGEIVQAILAAIEDAGMKPLWLGRLPTPALAAYAWSRGRAAFMATGSHIPFDRNGYKASTAIGELLKQDEAPIGERAREWRKRLYGQAAAESLFDARGMFRSGHRALPAADPGAAEEYLSRYTAFFAPGALAGLRLLVYEHSAVGRELLGEALRRLGAEVIPAGRSETFVPIDTENIDAERLAAIQALYDEARATHGALDAVVSTDGDSDRPLILGVEPRSGQVRFFAGDLVGMVTAEWLGADAVVVPISANDAIDRGRLAPVLEPKTRIGSPYVVEGMRRARDRGAKAVCGWEANGGFLTSTRIERQGRMLAPLETRDALLPILAVLAAAREQALALTELFAKLPARFSRAALLKEFPRALGQKIVARFTPGVFTEAEVRRDLEKFFSREAGFARIARLDLTDGVRILFENGEVAHIRPSGNADEMRFYSVADTAARAEEMTALGVAEPDGILRRLARFVTAGS
jgi:phosphomannomutase